VSFFTLQSGRNSRITFYVSGVSGEQAVSRRSIVAPLSKPVVGRLQVEECMEAKHENPVTVRFTVSKSQLFMALLVGVLVGSVALRAVLLRDYIFSTLLISDDTIFVGSFLFGGPLSGPKAQEAFYGTLKYLAASGSLVPPKLYLLFLQSVILLSFYRIIVRFGGSRVMAAALALFATCYPISVDQNYFMSGAHPTAAVAVFMVFCVAYVESLFRTWIANKLLYFAFLALQGTLLYVCGFSSPTFTLMPLMLIPATVLAILVTPGEKKWNLVNLTYVALSVIPMAVYYQAIHHHHYSDLVGWSEYSLARIFENFGKSLGYIFLRPFKENVLALVGYVTGLVVVMAACLATIFSHRGRVFAGRVDAKLVAFVAFLLIASALTFGPSSILVFFTTRYVVPAATIAFLLLALLVAVIFRQVQGASSAHNMALWSGSALLAIVAIAHNVNRTNLELEPFKKSDALIKAALESVPVGDEDQLLVILPKGYKTPTSGYNHWSTWYLRVLTGNPNVIGLVGSDYMRRQLDASELFVDGYRDHGKEYWDVANGRSYRKRMKGLERDRRLFVLSPDGAGGLSQKPLIFWHEETLFSMASGQSPEAMTIAPGGGNICVSGVGDSSALQDAVWVVSNPKIPNADQFRKIIDTSYQADAKSSEVVPVKTAPGRLTFLRVVLSSEDTIQNETGATSFTNTYPSMPMKGPDFSVYLSNDSYRILSRNNGVAQAQVTAVSDEDLEISMIGCPGKFALLSVNGEFSGVIPDASFAGSWELGKGFLDRYWAGDIESFTVATEPE
jgi:hypothetical protein